MSLRYASLLSPLAVGNVIFKNRMVATAGFPRAMGEDQKLNEKIITHFSERAKNGASSVLVNCGIDMNASTDQTSHGENNYVRIAISEIRKYGSIACTYVEGGVPHRPIDEVPTLDPPTLGRQFLDDPDDKEWNARIAQMRAEYPGEVISLADSLTKADIQNYIDTSVKNALNMKALGFEMLSIHNAYRNNPGGNLWSPLTNHRTDEYGGSVKNRARLFLELSWEEISH